MIKNIKNTIFTRSNSLKMLNLDYNKIENINLYVFRNLNKLLALKLAGMNIRNIYDGDLNLKYIFDDNFDTNNQIIKYILLNYYF
jgi:hypothetical protein